MTPNTFCFQSAALMPIHVCKDIADKKLLRSLGEKINIFITNCPHIKYQSPPLFLEPVGKLLKNLTRIREGLGFKMRVNLRYVDNCVQESVFLDGFNGWNA